MTFELGLAFMAGWAFGYLWIWVVRKLYPGTEDELFKEYLRREYGSKDKDR